MKKILGLLLLSSSLFSMDLAYKLQTPYNRFNRVKSAVVKNNKAKIFSVVSQVEQTVSNTIDTPKVQIDASSIHAPKCLGKVELYHGTKGFVLLHDKKEHVIEKCFMDSIARNITPEQLKPFLKTGYFAINQTNDGTFTLKAHHRLVGGGPLFGGFMYWLTKSVCYGGLVAAAGTAVVGTGGAVALAVAGPAAAASGGTATILAMGAAGSTIPIGTTAVATTVGTTILTTAGVGVGVASTGTAVGIGTTLAAAGVGATATATKVAVLTTGAVVASGASTGGIIAGIEALSVAVGTFFGMLPTP